MTKRIFAGILAGLVLWFSVTIPARAFVPVVVLGAPQVVTASGTSYALGALAGLVGVVGMYLEIKDLQDNALRIPLTDDHANDPPAPLVPSVTDPVVITEYIYQVSTCATGTSLDSACAAALQNCMAPEDGTYGKVVMSCTETQWQGAWYVKPDGQPFLAATLPVTKQPQSTSNSCPPGYNLNGSECILTDAREAVSDNNIDFQRDVGGLSPMSEHDPDNGKFAYTNIDGIVSVYGTSPDGHKWAYWVHSDHDTGMTTITSTGETQAGIVTQEQYQITSAGALHTAQIRQAAATLQQNPDTGVAEIVAPQTSQITNPDGSTSTAAQPLTQVQVIPAPGQTGTGSGTQPIEFPNDYARDATLQPVRDAVTPTVNLDDPLVPETMPDFGESFSSLLSWQLPAHSSECSTASFDAIGETYTIDAHCQLTADHMGTFQAVMAVVWLLLGLFVVLRA